MNVHESEKEYGLSGPFDFVIESALPIAFGESLQGTSLWESKQPGDHKIGVATHGGSPKREEVTTFFACGPSVTNTVVKGHRSMVDEAPTMAEMLGLSMKDVDGVSIKEVLR